MQNLINAEFRSKHRINWEQRHSHGVAGLYEITTRLSQQITKDGKLLAYL